MYSLMLVTMFGYQMPAGIHTHVNTSKRIQTIHTVDSGNFHGKRCLLSNFSPKKFSPKNFNQNRKRPIKSTFFLHFFFVIGMSMQRLTIRRLSTMCSSKRTTQKFM